MICNGNQGWHLSKWRWFSFPLLTGVDVLLKSPYWFSYLIISQREGGGGETYFTNDNINCPGLKVRIVSMACLECWKILTLYLLMPLKILPGWNTSCMGSQILFCNKVPRHLCSVNINCNTKTHWYWRRRLRMRHPPY